MSMTLIFLRNAFPRRASVFALLTISEVSFEAKELIPGVSLIISGATAESRGHVHSRRAAFVTSGPLPRAAQLKLVVLRQR